MEKTNKWGGSLELRPAGLADEPLLRALFASSLELELAYLDPAQRETFLELQWRAREHDYRSRYPDSHDQVIVADGLAAGRLLTARTPGELVIIDLVLRPKDRGRGIGSTLLRRLLAEAADELAVVQLYVVQTNPAMRLYERLGFSEVARFAPYVLMACRPSHSARQ